MTNNNSHRAKNILIAIVMVLFTSLIAPKLPNSVTKYLENPIIKIGLFLLIAYLATKDLPTAMIAVVAVLVSYQTLSVHKITETVIKKTEEILSRNQEPVNRIDNHIEPKLAEAHNINQNYQNYNNHPIIKEDKEFNDKLLIPNEPKEVTPSPPDNITINKKLMTKMLKGDCKNVEYNVQQTTNFDLVNGDPHTLTNVMAQDYKPTFQCSNNPNIIDENAYDKDFISYQPLN